MCYQGGNGVVTKALTPVELLAQLIFLVAIVNSLTTTVGTLTITNNSGIVCEVVAVADVKVAGDVEGEVVRKVELCISNSLEGVAYGSVGVQFVLTWRSAY